MTLQNRNHYLLLDIQIMVSKSAIFSNCHYMIYVFQVLLYFQHLLLIIRDMKQEYLKYVKILYYMASLDILILFYSTIPY